MDLLGLVHQYCFQSLENSLSAYLKSILSLKNVCTIYDTACLYNLSHLKQHSAQFIDAHASEIINTNEFLLLSPVNLFRHSTAVASAVLIEAGSDHAVNRFENRHRTQDRPVGDATTNDGRRKETTL